MTDSIVTQYLAQHDGGNMPIMGPGTLLLPEDWGNPERSVSYTLDLVGNRTNVNDNNVNTAYSPDNINRYTDVGGNAVQSGPEHQVGIYENNTYEYVGDSYVATINGSASYTLGYDALGRCVSRTLNGTITYYIYDGEKPILEFTQAGGLAAKNVYGRAVDEILMRTDYVVNQSGVTYYYQDNHEGSVTQLTDASAAVIESYRYDAFGAVTIKDGSGNVQTLNGLPYSPLGNRFMFTGREYIQQFGIYEYRARTYHPGLGRFLSEDPKGFDAGDYNLFRYCKNDPEDLTDPMGLVSGYYQYQLVFDPKEKLDKTHDGYHVEGVPGTEEKSGGVHLAVDRNVTTVNRIGNSKDGGETKVVTTVSDKNGTPAIHSQINVQYASGAGPKMQSFSKNNEWTHSADAIKYANSLRSNAAAWVSALHLSGGSAVSFIRNGGQLPNSNLRMRSLRENDQMFYWDQRQKWDDRLGPNAWRTPDGSIVAPHTAIDPSTGNPIHWED